MNATPEEKKKLADLLQKMMISDSYEYALAAQEYYELVKKIKEQKGSTSEPTLDTLKGATH